MIRLLLRPSRPLWPLLAKRPTVSAALSLAKASSQYANERGAVLMEKLKIGVLLSGSGTNLQAIIDEIANGLPVEIVHVLSSRPDAYGIERARAAGIPVTVFDRSCYEDREAADARIAAIMQEAGAEYLVMAGYMRKLTPVVLDAFPDHVLNLHPGAAALVQGGPCHPGRMGCRCEGDGRDGAPG